MPRPCQRPRRRRFGFTLIELLIVVVILGILIALLVPVISSAVRRANNAAVSSDINLLATALAAFKEKYGDYPPSRIMLVENGYYPTSDSTPLSSVTWLTYPALAVGTPALGDANMTFSPNDLTVGQLAQRSLRYLRKFWPQAQFSSTGPLYTAATGWHDFNGVSVSGVGPDPAPILLQGHECLAFFLGGIPERTGGGSTIGMTGFGKNPQNPFQSSTITTTRNEPMFQFDNGRLLDDDGDGIPGYVDRLAGGGDARYYAYFSAYGSGGYDPNDVNFAEPDISAPIGRAFRVGFGVLAPYNGVPNMVMSYAPNPYTTGEPVPSATGLNPTSYVNPNTYQIISSGTDRLYGFGGRYAPNAEGGNKLPLNDSEIVNALAAEARVREQDNLSNFTTGRLEP